MLRFFISDRAVGLTLFVLGILFAVFDDSGLSLVSSPIWTWLTIVCIFIAGKGVPSIYRSLFLGIAIGLLSTAIWGGGSQCESLFCIIFSIIFLIKFFTEKK